LGYMVYASVMEPVKYQTTIDRRQKVIINKLLNIKELQIEFKNKYGNYAGTFDSLKNFYLYGKMPVVLKVGTNDTLSEERALALKLISRDTSFISVRDTLLKGVKNFNIETIDIVPFTDGKVKFELNSGFVDRGNFKVSVFEVTCLMADYLKDIEQKELLDNQLIQMKNAEKFPGLRLGSMEEPTTDGNWQ